VHSPSIFETPDADSESRPLGDAPRWRREQFIPIRREALIKKLADESDLSPPQRREFRELIRLLEATFHHEYHEHLAELKASYAPFNPDDDTRTVEDWPGDVRHRLQEQLFRATELVLRRANYQRLSQLDIEQAVGAASDWGVRLQVDFSVFERLEVFVRGDVVGRRKRRHWRDLFRERDVDVPIYQRLVVVFSLKNQKFSDANIDTTAVYLKLFKNIPKIDVDMLLPGSRVRMTLLDRSKIFLPTVSGVVVTIAKIIKGALWVALTGTFWGLMAFLGLIVGTIGYGARSFFGYLRTKDKYQLSLTRNLYYQNLDNNAGVFHRLLDEAEDQEMRETIVAYFLLWKRAPENGWTEKELDAAAESYLSETIHVTVDFESHDAVVKLLRLGLASQAHDRLRATAPQQALACLDAAWDGYFHH
jgi:hypothetical protein